jgi:hypothetical protein
VGHETAHFSRSTGENRPLLKVDGGRETFPLARLLYLRNLGATRREREVLLTDRLND